MTNLILCGGAGTRLWPLSRNRRPKQFYPLFGGKSLFQETIQRNLLVVDRFMVAVNINQHALAVEQSDSLQGRIVQYLLEPTGRNTAPAIALACLQLPRDELVFVTPSDHRMNKLVDYHRAVVRAQELAVQGYLVTFGILPTYPETGFGYIEASGEVVVAFREKPDLPTAKSYLDSGKYLWNSGMFVFQAGVFLDELAKHHPAVLTACRAADGLSPSLEAMAAIPSVSIDYAVMEKSDRVRVVACDPGWSDLGSFDALAEEVDVNESGNGVLGSPLPVFHNSTRNLVLGSGRRVVLVGVDDLLVVDTPDALLISRKGKSQQVKDVVAQLKDLEPSLLD